MSYSPIEAPNAPSASKVLPNLIIEDFNETSDAGLTRDCLVPYLRDLYSDLIIRCIQPRAVKAQMLDKITFLQFTCLPGIVAERLFTIMDQKDQFGCISQLDFIETLTTIYIGDFKSRAKLLFEL